MNRWIYPTLFYALAVLVILSGCAGRTVKKNASTEQSEATQGGSEMEEQEASLRGKKFIPSPELATIYFDYDRAELNEEARAALKRNAEWLKTNSKVGFQIQGHCDERGTTQYNLALGQRRAVRVRDYYKALGIRMGRMSTISYGEELPVCKENVEECWQQNRRAETLVRKK
ncbi:MAG: peptidoglycan-associated lipoprotein Pal [Elusimicrobia bacterium]|nr:peptidoglycan-associated lipoprotein Pal [Elusimicrobiota bacterium]